METLILLAKPAWLVVLLLVAAWYQHPVVTGTTVAALVYTLLFWG
jgi:hypothetical protein